MTLLFTEKCAIQQKLVLANTQEMIIFFNREGRITDANVVAVKELGYGKEIYNLSIYDIFRTDFKYENNRLVILLNNHNTVAETIAYRKNQTCFPVDLNINIYEKKKAYIGICTAMNIARAKEAICEKDRLQYEMDILKINRVEITANITHELRTPVNGIKGLSANLLDTELQSNQRESLQLIMKCCNDMNTIINDLLDYAKLANEKMVLEQREFDFSDFIHTIVEINKSRICEKGIKLLVYISDDIPRKVIGDEFRLAQILNNLFSNAVKFTAIGQIALEAVKLTQTSSSVELFFAITDTGIGISNVGKDKLFLSFSQVDGSITRRFGGTGLGLAICKELVEAMGGTIRVESEENKGSTFSFSVHLKLPNQKSNKDNSARVGSDKIETDNYAFNSFIANTHHSDCVENRQEIENNEFIARLFRETDQFAMEDTAQDNSAEKPFINFTSVLERLSICIEMESWDKAEELAYHIKQQIPTEQREMGKIILRLLLSIRREDHDISIATINEIKAFTQGR